MAGINRTTGKATDLITFSRASVGTYLDSDGLLKTASTNIPRIEYDAAGNVKGLLIEEARTNLVTYSEDFTNASWLKLSAGTGSAPIVTANYATSPDGSQNATRLQASISADEVTDDFSLLQFALVAQTGDFTSSIWVKSNTGQSQILYFRVGTGTEAVVTTDWTRIDVTETLSSAPAYLTLGVRNSQGSQNVDILIYGAQLEEGSFPTSYIPTSGATATRAADIASISVDNFGYNQKAGTVVVDAISSVSNDENRLAVLTESSSNLRVVDLYRLSNALRMYDGTTVMGGGNITAPYELKVAGVYKSGNYALVVDGAVVSTTSNILVNSANTLKIGTNVYSARQLNGHIKSIAYYPRRLSNAQLQELTA